MRRTTLVRPRRLARSLAPVAVLALVSAFAAGCGDDGDGDADDEETVVVDQDGNTVDPDENESDDGLPPLTADQIAEAVLQPENLGDGWTAEPSSEDDGAAPGCLGDIETITDGLAEQDKGGTEFTYGDDDFPAVESTVSAYADEAAITAVFDQVQVALTGCTTIAETDEDGFTWDLTLTADEEVTLDVDDQSNVSASGTLTPEGGEALDIYIEWTNVRVGPNIGAITTFDLEPRAEEHDVWTEIAVERLKAVVEGEEPEATTAPAPA